MNATKLLALLKKVTYFILVVHFVITSLTEKLENIENTE